MRGEGRGIFWAEKLIVYTNIVCLDRAKSKTYPISCIYLFWLENICFNIYLCRSKSKIMSEAQNKLVVFQEKEIRHTWHKASGGFQLLM